MRVEQNGRSAGRCADLSEDRGHAFDLDDLRITARASQDLLRGRGGSSELRRVVSRMTDGRDAHEGLEVGTKLGHEFRNTVAQRSYGRLGLHWRSPQTTLLAERAPMTATQREQFRCGLDRFRFGLRLVPTSH